jgi:tetratricopeptide (TPR) repeat protein
MYTRAGRRQQAAEVWEEMGELDRAVALYLEDGNPRQAGELLANAGQLKAAIPHLEAGGALLRAGDCALRIQQPARAARLFARAQEWERAARHFEEAGEVTQALDAYTRLSQQLQKEAERGDGDAREQQRRIDLHRADRLARQGGYRDAAALFRRWGQPAQAAEMYTRAGAAAEAIQAWLEADQPQRALPLLEQARDDLDLTVHGQVLVRGGHADEAAKLFVQAGDIPRAAAALEAAGQNLKAAELWRQIHEPDRAAILFYRAERWSEAGEMFEAAGHFRNAAEAYVRAERHDRAAACYQRMDEPLKAAAAFDKAGLHDRAVELLQELPEDHPEFHAASHALSRLLVKEGNYQGALHLLEMTAQDPHATGPRALKHLYWKGRAYEGLEKWRQAEECYLRLTALKRGYEDVQERLERVQQAVDDERQRSRESSGILLSSGSGILGDPASTSPVPTAPAGAVVPGTVLVDRYEIQGELGHGGMSRVYRARDRVLGEEVAIKMLLPSYHGDDQKRLLREVQISRKITHPNVVRVYDVVPSPGGIFVTMELLDGPDLETLIRGEKRLSLTRVQQLLKEILEGLASAHRLKVIHRDLKPRNIILTRAGLKILDFGIARMEGLDLAVTSPGQIIGSPLYMSPEQVRGEELDGRADLYCVGLIAFGLLANQEPFRARTPEAVVFKQLHERPPELRKIRPTLPGPWLAFVEKLLQKDREERTADVVETLALLEGLPLGEG